MKERNYEALVAGMHKKETFEGAEEAIKKDFKLKLPDRRYIHSGTVLRLASSEACKS